MEERSMDYGTKMMANYGRSIKRDLNNIEHD